MSTIKLSAAVGERLDLGEAYFSLTMRLGEVDIDDFAHEFAVDESAVEIFGVAESSSGVVVGDFEDEFADVDAEEFADVESNDEFAVGDRSDVLNIFGVTEESSGEAIADVLMTSIGDVSFDEVFVRGIFLKDRPATDDDIARGLASNVVASSVALSIVAASSVDGDVLRAKNPVVAFCSVDKGLLYEVNASSVASSVEVQSIAELLTD